MADNFFSEEVIAKFRIIAGIRRLALTERDFLKREIELAIQSPNGIDEKQYNNLDEYHEFFAHFYSLAEAYCNFVVKIWKNEDVKEFCTHSTLLRYDVMRYCPRNLLNCHTPKGKKIRIIGASKEIISSKCSLGAQTISSKNFLGVTKLIGSIGHGY